MDKDYHKELKKEWKKLIKREEKYFAKYDEKAFKEKNINVINKIEEKVPEKVNKVLDSAFYQAFEKTFVNGEQIIEKTFDKDDISLEFDVNDFRIHKQPTKKSLKYMDTYAKKKQRKNQSFVTFEGMGMGVVGVSLVDIPVFLSMVLKGIYEISLSYGYDYNSKKEKIFILRLITAGLEKSDTKRQKDKMAEVVLFSDDEYNIEKEIAKTAKSMTKSLLVAKFIQSFVALGVVGGVMSANIYNDILEYASMKYKKRYLYSLQKENKLRK